jgi:hypothetical protein
MHQYMHFEPLSHMKGFYRFVCAHLTPHEPNVSRRISDYNHIVGSLLFDPLPSSTSSSKTTMYSTSHLFFLGDLNFRLSLPEEHPLALQLKASPAETLNKESTREELKEYDQLHIERRKGTAFIGLKDGEFWKFQCSYKYKLGEVDKYRYVPLVCSSTFVFTPLKAPNVPQHGQIEFSTLHTPTLPINVKSLISRISCTPRSLPIQPRIM